jgi:hypothetical protein
VIQVRRLAQPALSTTWTDPPKWAIHGERVVDDTPHIRISVADVELPNGVSFTQ